MVSAGKRARVRRCLRARRISIAGATIVVILGAERAVFAGMGLRPDTARRGLGDAEAGLQVRDHDAGGRRRSVRLESCAIASRSERWIVTGTTASVGDHSIITGCGACAAVGRQFGEKFGVAGMAESGAVEHALGDRIGDDGAGPSSDDIVDRLTDRGQMLRRRWCRRDAPGRAVAGWPVGDHRQGLGECGVTLFGAGVGEIRRSIPEALRALREEGAVAEQIEGGSFSSLRRSHA